jgi:hypothetical protein
MRGNPDKIKGKGFDKRPQNINKTGANRKTISAVNLELEKMGAIEASKKDITSCYLRLIQLTIPELEAKVKDSQQPALVRIVGKAIISGKGFDVIEKVLDRGIGKADQKIEHSGEITNKTNLSELSTEELIRRAEAMRTVERVKNE